MKPSFSKILPRSKSSRKKLVAQKYTPQTRLLTAIHDHDLTTAVEVLEQAGYTDTLTQVFLLGWLTPDTSAGGGSDA